MLKGCVAAGSFAWRVRRHERVHAAFGALFPDAGPLVTSIDTTFFTPEGGPALDEYSGSAHVDQNGRDSREPDLKGASIYQGILYVWAADDGCTTTCVWPRSHTSVWPSMLDDAEYKEAGQRGDHYFEIRWLRDAEKRRALQDGWEREHLRLRIPAGALLLWNSRTVHTGVKSGPRFAQAVCLEPASKRPPQHRAAKMRLAALGLPSTHWARIGHQHDVLPDYEGYLTTEEAHRRETAVAQGDGTAPHRGVLLPLRPAIRPAPSPTEPTSRLCVRSLGSIGRTARSARTSVFGIMRRARARPCSRRPCATISSSSCDDVPCRTSATCGVLVMRVSRTRGLCTRSSRSGPAPGQSVSGAVKRLKMQFR